MSNIIVCNILLILALAALGFFFGPTLHRKASALFTLYLATWFSILGWGIFVIVHFVSKFW